MTLNGNAKFKGILTCDLENELKLMPSIFYQIFIFSPNDSLIKTMKSVFYFI